MAAAQDLPEPAASGEKDQMGLASLPGRPPSSFPPASGAATDPRLPHPEERPSGIIPGHLGRGRRGGDWKGPEYPVLRTQDPEPADRPPLPASALDLGHTGVAVVPPPGMQPLSHCLSLPNEKPPLNPRLPHHPTFHPEGSGRCSWPSRGGLARLLLPGASAQDWDGCGHYHPDPAQRPVLLGKCSGNGLAPRPAVCQQL